MNSFDFLLSTIMLLALTSYVRFCWIPDQVKKQPWGDDFLKLEAMILAATSKDDLDQCLSCFYQFNDGKKYTKDWLYRMCFKRVVKMIQRKYHFYTSIES
jgi:hypothetical protein